MARTISLQLQAFFVRRLQLTADARNPSLRIPARAEFSSHSKTIFSIWDAPGEGPQPAALQISRSP
jgi:hypothetical protein